MKAASIKDDLVQNQEQGIKMKNEILLSPAFISIIPLHLFKLHSFFIAFTYFLTCKIIYLHKTPVRRQRRQLDLISSLKKETGLV